VKTCVDIPGGGLNSTSAKSARASASDIMPLGARIIVPSSSEVEESEEEAHRGLGRSDEERARRGRGRGRGDAADHFHGYATRHGAC